MIPSLQLSELVVRIKWPSTFLFTEILQKYLQAIFRQNSN